MNALTKARLWLARTIAGTKAASFLEYPEGVPIWKWADYASYLEAGSKKIWATFRAVDLVATATASTSFGVYRKGGQQSVTPPAPLAQLLEYPNEFETFFDFLYRLVFHLRFTGNAFILKDEMTGAAIQPKGLYLLDPKCVKIIPNSTTKISRYEYQSQGATRVYQPNEVIHIKRPHPNSEYYGLGDMEAGEVLLSGFINRNTWEQNFWKNGAAPSGIMVLEDEKAPEKDEWEKGKAEFESKYGGAANAGKRAWLWGKWKYEQLGLSAVDMQNIEQSRWSVEQIFHLHGVPLSVAGIREAANYATAKTDEILFRQWSVLPTVLNIQRTLNSDLIQDWGNTLEIRFAVEGLQNVGQTILDLTPLFDRGGISPNEIRERIGMARIDNPLFDAYYINAGLMPLDLAGMATGGEQTEEQAQRIIERFVTQSLGADGKPTGR